MKFITFWFVMSAILFSGCSTVTEYWPWSEDEKVESKPKQTSLTEEDYGYVSYIESGDAATIDAKRKDAFYQMYAECNGKYEVVDEKSEDVSTVSFSNREGDDFNENIKKITIKFICPE